MHGAHRRCSVTVLFLTHKKAKVQNIYLMTQTQLLTEIWHIRRFFIWFASEQFDQKLSLKEVF